MIELLIDRLWEGARSGLWADREALDAIADLNPETELGRVLTSVMGKVCQVNLLDPLLGFTRDGFHWLRPDRRRFLEANEAEGAWNSGNVQTVGGGCLVVGDKLFIY